jgi:hypothetical protein
VEGKLTRILRRHIEINVSFCCTFKERDMHLCPHCNQLGITALAALNVSPNGLVECRRCHGVVKRTRWPSIFIALGIVGGLLFNRYVHTPYPFPLFWGALFIALGAMLTLGALRFKRYDQAPDRTPLKGKT